MTMSKRDELRKMALQKRRALSGPEVKLKSKIIAEKIIASKAFENSKLIYAYSAANNEVDISSVVSKAFELDKKVAMPLVLDRNGHMVFKYISSFDDLHKGYMGILEPGAELKDALGEGLILIPGVAYDRKLHRYGYGGGYYDRFLADNRGLIKLGVSFELQIYEELLEIEEHDQKMDMIITEEEILI